MNGAQTIDQARLQDNFMRAWSGLGATGDFRAACTELMRRYSEPWRKYHTLQHLNECLDTLDLVPVSQMEALGIDEAALSEIRAALWFHDAIYELRGHDNEAESAALARRHLGYVGVDADRIHRVSNMILATKHTVMPEGASAQLLVDVDLSILGAPKTRFAEYERQIREEYSFVPGPIFRAKRREILEGFLDRQQIYMTDFMFKQFNDAAKANLRGAISS